MIRVLAVGKVKERGLAALVSGYARRIRPLAPFELLELRDSGPEREAAEMLAKLGSRRGSELVVALDERGEEITSRQLAALLGAHGSLAFLIGGADGLGPAARERADRTLRLSALTLTHEMARLLLVEQIYRGLTILRGMPYHRD
jgi:23S rRNA (pseudouridine1915-N3)-methyltransferase